MTGASLPSPEPLVDLIVAVHTPERDVSRAVNSVLHETRAPVRVTVVCHNTPVAGIAGSLGSAAHDRRVRLVELQDGIRSPAGPFNRGLELATAPYVSVLGSDDELAPGAIDSWLDRAERSGAGAVLARVQHVGGRTVPSPPSRPFRQRALHPVRDRLNYRSAPLGLVSREQFPDLRFTTGVRTGEDIGYVTVLWHSGTPIEYDRRGPAYLIHADGAERVTTLAPPIQDDLEFLEPLLGSRVYQELGDQAQASLLVKTFRSTLFSLVQNRPNVHQWPVEQRERLAAVSELLYQELSGTRQGLRALSRADFRLLDLMRNSGSPTEEMLIAANARRLFLTKEALLPRRLRDVFLRDAPVRFAIASVLARW